MKRKNLVGLMSLAMAVARGFVFAGTAKQRSSRKRRKSCG